jgi:hypothetical protein
MAEIIAEFSYWSYGMLSGNAIAPRPEVTVETVDEIAAKHRVKTIVTQASPRFYMFAGTPSRYQRVTVRVVGEDAEAVKGFAREMILTYGGPDEVPLALSSARRAGNAILDSLLREYKRG